jgi:glutaredoxin
MGIKILTTKTCAFCPMVKKYLDLKGLHYTEEDITNYSYTELREIEKKYKTFRVPITIFPDGTFVSGYNIGNLSDKVNELTQEFENLTLTV